MMTAKQRDFDTILDDCLARVRAGESLETCLADYPDLASQLRPLLVTAAGLQSLGAPVARSEAFATGRQRMLDAVEVMWPANYHPTPETVSGGNWLTWLRRRLAPPVTRAPVRRLAVALLLVVFISGILATAASAGALPGDVLYPVKRTWEEVRLFLTVDDETRLELEAEQAQERLREINRLIETGRPEEVTFTGQLLEMGERAWRIGDLLVLVDRETVVQGDPAVGRWLEVRAMVQNDGQVRALRIQVQAGPDEPQGLPPTGPQGPKGPTQTPRANAEPSRTPPAITPKSTVEPSPTPQPTSTAGQRATPTRTPEPSRTPRQTTAPSHTPSQAGGPTQSPTHGSNQTAAPTQGLNQTAAPTQGPQPSAGPNQTPAPTQGSQQTPGPDHTPGSGQTPGPK